jgi:hypothetical protein
MAFSSTAYQTMYRRFLGDLAKPVTLKINNGTTFKSYRDVLAYVSKYRESDLVQGGSIEIGDLKLVIPTEYLPSAVTVMGRKDRISIDDRNYSVIHWDAESRAMGEQSVAIEVTIRG